MSAGKSQDPKPLSTTPISINTAVFSLLAAKPDHQVFSVSLRDIEQVLKPKKCVDPATLLPAQYHKFLDVFSKDNTNKLPPLHPGVDHKIKMEPGTQAPSGPLYSMSREELEVLKKYLTENLNKGFIQASSSPAAAPVLFVKKPGDGLCFCVDYRALRSQDLFPVQLHPMTITSDNHRILSEVPETSRVPPSNHQNLKVKTHHFGKLNLFAKSCDPRLYNLQLQQATDYQ